jgi:hypothetical protein
MRRFTAKFSEGLSPEGRMAMEQTAMQEADNTTNSGHEDIDNVETSTYIRRRLHKRRSKTISFTGTFNEPSASKSNKDAGNKSDLKRRRSSSVNNGKELELTGYRDTSEKYNDEQVVESNKLQSVEKCLVWIETQNKDPK